MEEITLWAAPHDGRYERIEAISRQSDFWKRGNRLTSETERLKTLIVERFGDIPFLKDEEPILDVGPTWLAAKFIGEVNEWDLNNRQLRLIGPILTNRSIIILKHEKKWKIGSETPLDEVKSAAGIETKGPSHVEVRLKNDGNFLLFFYEHVNQETRFYAVRSPPTISNRWATAINNAIAHT